MPKTQPRLHGRILPIASLLTFAAAATGYSQEYFREFGTSRSSSGMGRLTPGAEVFTGNDAVGATPITAVDVTANQEVYNLRYGNLDFVIAAGIAFEFNDNITLADKNRISDIAIRPELDIEGVWRISENNNLKFGLGIGYAFYLNHSEYNSDSLLLSPNSAIEWTAKMGSFTVTFRERLSYQEDTFDEPTISNVSNYNRWENQAGVQVDWDTNEYTRISVGYDRYDLWVPDEAFKSQERGMNTFYIRPAFQLSPYVSAGLNASISFVDYREELQSDAKVYMVGPFIKWKINDATEAYVEVGYQRSDFDSSSRLAVIDASTGRPTGAFIADQEDSSAVYFKVELVNRPTENFRHKLSASKTTELGMGSNFYDLYHFEYSADWKLAENTSISPTLFYEYYETSGEPSEEGNRFGAGLGIYHIFTEHLTVGLDYRFVWKDSNIPDTDYYQNLGLISLYYKF